MAVSITGIYSDITSDRSRRIAVTAGSSLADVIAAIETVLTTAPGGWSIHDASAGANAKCYKSLQKDGTSYTYMVLDWNTTISTGVTALIVRLYEDWNASTHVGTNKAENSKDRANGAISEYLQGQKLPHGETDPWQLDVHVLPGGAAFFASRESAQVSVNSVFSGSPTYGGVTLIGECLRESPVTLPVGVPAAVWINSGKLAYTSGYASNWQISVCRTYLGAASSFGGFVAFGMATIDVQFAYNGFAGGYVSTLYKRPYGAGGRPYVSSISPLIPLVANPTVTTELSELGQIRGVLCVGQGNTNNSVWEVSADSDYIPAFGGTNRKFRCYVPSIGPVCLLLPL